MTPSEQPTETRPRAARGEGERLREQLLDAASELVHEQGTAAKLSIRQVTKRAGVSPMALYLHFESLPALIGELVEHGFLRFGSAINAAASLAGDDPVARMQAMGVAYLRFAREEPAIYSVIFGAEHERQHAENGGEHPQDGAGSAAFESLVQIIEVCQAAGVGRPGDSRALAIGVWTSMHGFATLCTIDDNEKMPWPADEDFAAMIYDAWLSPR